MKKLISLCLIISVTALGISLFNLRKLRLDEEKFTESYNLATKNTLKLVEKLHPINLDLLDEMNAERALFFLLFLFNV